MTQSTPTLNQSEKPTIATCGIVMPISLLDGCSADHWNDVRRILVESIESCSSPRFQAKLVSDAEDVGIIQKRIIQSLYDSDIVVCDVSGKNPNVMFELGLRLAFDRPVVIVKDDKTDYSFDTGIIEHVIYPRDLRFTRIVEFKTALASKVASTHAKYPRGGKTSPFLGAFGSFEVATIEHKQVSSDRLVLSAIEELQGELRMVRRRIETFDRSSPDDRSRTDIGTRRVREAVVRLGTQLPAADVARLGEDKDLLARIESEVMPHRYFDSPTEFRECVARAVREIARA
jgi:hypothetical protein